MAYQVLARKWRPKKYEEVVGQSHIATSLQNALKQNRIGHAYIFVGTRGIGKTTMARIFAKSLRCSNLREDGNPCLECVSCLSIDKGQDVDVIEIDGASNNGVDDIRQLIDNLQYLPISGKYKVYIIDEVHMLSASAFNALLKTLEEPPAHVIFLFATTNPEKLLGTVLSRCQRFDYRNAKVDDLVSHIKMISKSEGIIFKDESLIKIIAKQGKGSVRDALSILEQVLSFTSDRVVTEQVISQSLGLASISVLKTLTESFLKGDSEKVQSIYHQLKYENIELTSLAYSLIEFLFNEIESIDKTDINNDEPKISRDILKQFSAAELFWIYENLNKDFFQAKNSIDTDGMIYLALQKIAKRREFLTTKLPSILDGEKKKSEQLAENIEQELIPKDLVEETPPKNWEEFLNYLSQINPPTKANLEQGNITHFHHEDDLLQIKIGFPTAAKLFYDHVNSIDVKQSIKKFLSEFFNISDENVHFTAAIVGEESFQSKAELDEIERRELDEKRLETIANNRYIKIAEEIFNTKVNKIMLNKEE